MLLIPDYPFTTTLARAPSGRSGPFHTVRKMREFVELGKVDPLVMRTAVRLVIEAPPRDEWREVESIFNYVRGSVRYVRDVVGVETLADPATTLRRMVGDCDDKATLLAAMLESVGYPCRFVMASYHGDDFEHVYLQCLLLGNWYDLDPTEIGPVGYAPPEPRRIWIEPIYGG